MITDHLVCVPENHGWVLGVVSSETSTSEDEHSGLLRRRVRHLAFGSDPPDGFVDLWLDAWTPAHKYTRADTTLVLSLVSTPAFPPTP